jgi:Ca2+-binding EF-hand superfamily protein
MRTTLPLLIALGLAFGSMPAALAETPATKSATHWFEIHDRNGDGYLTFEEVVSYELTLMRQADKSGDGRLSLGEFIAGIPQNQPDQIDRYRRRFTAMDTDHDGFVVPEELTTFYRFLLKTSDTNGDGYVSLQEWLGATEGE